MGTRQVHSSRGIEDCVTLSPLFDRPALGGLLAIRGVMMELNKHCVERIIERAARYGLDCSTLLEAAVGLPTLSVPAAFVLHTITFNEYNVVHFVVIQRGGVGQTAEWTGRATPVKLRVDVVLNFL